MRAKGAAHPHEHPHHPHWPLAGLLFLFVFLLGILSVHESATWLHIRTGADIMQKDALPGEDGFSYTAAGKPWTTESWLADVAFALLHERFGVLGVTVFKSLVAAAAFALLLPFNAGSPLAAAGVLSAGAMASWAGFTESPAIFDLLILSLFLRLLRPRRAWSFRVLTGAFFLEFAWANLNGPSALLGVWLVALKLLKTSLKSGSRDRIGFAATLAAVFAALLINPHGWELIPRVFVPVTEASWSGPVLWVFSLAAAVGMVSCWVCLQQEFFLAMGAASLLALSVVFPSLRAAALLSLCPVVSLALGHFLHPLGDTLGRVARLAVALAGFLYLHAQWLYHPLGRTRGYGAQSLEGAITYLQANGISGRLFNEAEAGDHLIGAGGRPVFADGRAALHGPAFLKDAARWPVLFRRLDEVYGFDYAVVLNRRGEYPARALDSEPWRLVYADDSALVYVKKTGANAWLVAGKPRPLITPNHLWPESLDALLAEAKKVPVLLEELDRWILQAPDSAQALLWKAYALDRLGLAEKAQRLLSLASARERLKRDPELMACHAYVLEKRGEKAGARRLYKQVVTLARRAESLSLEARALERLAPMARESGKDWEAKLLEERSRELLAAVSARRL